MYKAGVITVSDKGFTGERVDTGGPLTAELLRAAGYEVAYTAIVPDERDQISRELLYASEELDLALVVTTGGTGFSPRDVTPEATIAVCERLTPGIPEAMRQASMRVTPRGMLSRAQAGIHGSTLILNLPGSPKAIRENLEAVLPSLEHGLEMLRGPKTDCAQE
jgi:molybdopterin adenylyltransferase